MGNGFIIAAPGSGSGKTTLTLGILRALTNRGVAVRGAKSGPDYIDPRFHEAACGRSCFNLDAWAMEADRIKALVSGEELLIIEGAMGLFDGAPPNGKGASADLARILNLPVVLVVDAAHMAQSVAPLVAGFAAHDTDVHVAGVVLNKVGSPRHETMLRDALAPLGLPVLGALYRQPGLDHPSRHLGLVQAGERDDLESWLDHVADVVAESLDLDALTALAAALPDAPAASRLTAPGTRIAIASDKAFAFAYPHILDDWCAEGAEILPFSPLADEAPAPDADFIFLPGGYPELYGNTLAKAEHFKAGMRAATCPIYGECGGYMVLGEAITDAEGRRHEMLGLLGLETSFAKRKLHLGYRHASAKTGSFPGDWNAHEFHYATTLKAEGTPLFSVRDAAGNELPPAGLINGHVSGSFIHLIDRADRGTEYGLASLAPPDTSSFMTANVISDDRLARRNVIVLVLAQSVVGAQMPMIFAIAGLAGQSLAPNPLFATLPISLTVLANTIMANPMSWFMQRYGRRAGFWLGAAGGTLGAMISAYALTQSDFYLFLVGAFFTGFYQSAQGFFRFAAADTASDAFRPKAISYVMAGGLAAAIVGPQLLKVTAQALPVSFLGAYIAVVVLNLFGAVLFTAIKIPNVAQADETGAPKGRTTWELLTTPTITVAIIVAMVSYALMNLVMTSTPLAVVGCGFDQDRAFDIVSAHVLAMFIPSFFTGHLIARFGTKKIVAAGLVILASAGFVGMMGVELENFFVALILLGIGWNFGFIGATTMLAGAHESYERGRIQGMNDMIVFGGVTIASLASGGLMNGTGGTAQEGWMAVNLAMIPFLALAGAALIWLVMRPSDGDY